MNYLDEEEFVLQPRIKYQHFVPEPEEAVTYTTTQIGRYRIQNNSAAGYLVFIGVDGMPDLDGNDYTFQTTLPITIAHAPADETLYVVVRYRDSYGITSVNVHPYIITLDGDGLVRNALPQPQDVKIYVRPNNMLRVLGSYPTRTLEKHPADKVKVWVDSDPEVDMATLTFNISKDTFLFDFGSYSAGDYTIHTALYRTVDDVKSEVVTLEVSVPAAPSVPYTL